MQLELKMIIYDVLYFLLILVNLFLSSFQYLFLYNCAQNQESWRKRQKGKILTLLNLKLLDRDSLKAIYTFKRQNHLFLNFAHLEKLHLWMLTFFGYCFKLYCQLFFYQTIPIKSALRLSIFLIQEIAESSKSVIRLFPYEFTRFQL